MSIQAVDLKGSITQINEEQLDKLRRQVHGKVIAPSDGEYDEARKIWNGMIDRRPSLVIECTGTADVLLAVRFAKEHGLVVSVRGAGHNIAGRCLRDNVLLIDLSKMRSVIVDP